MDGFRFLRGGGDLHSEEPGVFLVRIHNDRYTWVDSIWTTLDGANERAREIANEARNYRSMWSGRRGSIVKFPLDAIPPPMIDDGIN